MAIELAAEPEKLAAIKQKLQENRNITPLFDTPLFTKNLEAAYIKMMERYQADLQPDHVFVAQLGMGLGQEFFILSLLFSWLAFTSRPSSLQTYHHSFQVA